MWEEFKTIAWEFFAGQGKAIAWSIALLAIGILVISIITKQVRKQSLKSRKIDNSAAPFVTSIVSLLAYVALFLLLVWTLGFSTESIIAGFASVALAIALGLQNTLASLANGILLIFTSPFKAGDFVSIGDTSGTVKEIKLFSVKLVTIDNLTIIIPNNTVFGSTIINYSKMPLRRIDLVIPAAYDVDVAKLKALVFGIVNMDSRIAKDPAPFFRLTEYGKNSLNFTLRAWTESAIYWDVRFDLLENIIAVLRANDIRIPYEQLDVHMVDGQKGD
ncbi:MAG: mechanosensitive ion channel [Clostridia bacterium]|nr:mechanosensitive ion channel [Clostridia bacterium]